MLAALFAVLSTHTINAEGFFKWKDARGNTQYGDQPPANAKAERFKMPEITVIDGYKEQWKPLNDAANNPVATTSTRENVAKKQNQSGSYTKFLFVAPRANQTIRGGFHGEVSAMLSVKPPLKKGHQIVFLLDGKEVSRSTSRTNNFSKLSGGAHTVSANIIDQGGNSVMTSSASFNVIRKLNHKKLDAKKLKAKRATEALQASQNNFFDSDK